MSTLQQQRGCVKGAWVFGERLLLGKQAESWPLGLASPRALEVAPWVPVAWGLDSASHGIKGSRCEGSN